MLFWAIDMFYASEGMGLDLLIRCLSNRKTTIRLYMIGTIYVRADHRIPADFVRLAFGPSMRAKAKLARPRLPLSRTQWLPIGEARPINIMNWPV